jgi:hypothetical protein
MGVIAKGFAKRRCPAPGLGYPRLITDPGSPAKTGAPYKYQLPSAFPIRRSLINNGVNCLDNITAALLDGTLSVSTC